MDYTEQFIRLNCSLMSDYKMMKLNADMKCMGLELYLETILFLRKQQEYKHDFNELDLLADQAGELKFRVQGQIGPRQRPQLYLEVDGVLSLRCQRCLEGIDYPVKVRKLIRRLRRIRIDRLISRILFLGLKSDIWKILSCLFLKSEKKRLKK